jgi:hypothetical protein
MKAFLIFINKSFFIVMDNELHELLEKWYDAKIHLNTLEEQCNKYRHLCERLMDKRELHILKAGEFSVVRKTMQKTTISKRDLPANIWNQYSTICEYSTMTISKDGKTVRKKSVPRKNSRQNSRQKPKENLRKSPIKKSNKKVQ